MTYFKSDHFIGGSVRRRIAEDQPEPALQTPIDLNQPVVEHDQVQAARHAFGAVVARMREPEIRQALAAQRSEAAMSSPLAAKPPRRREGW